MNLVIVESPNKIKKIQKILGNKFKIMASLGHFRDLPKSEMAIDFDNNFKPKYVITKNKVVSDLKKACQNKSCIYIATDPDREGEGIAFHLVQVLNLKYPKYRRMTFHEITPRAIQDALVTANQDGKLNMAMANAYQARRVIDRVVGYTVSPILWEHITGAKSAGRVQSIATRLILDKENIINEHKEETKFLISGTFNNEKVPEFKAKLEQIPKEHKEALNILELAKDSEFKVGDCKTKIVWHSPPGAFKTSVFQQEAGKRFGLTPKQSMGIAQKLYEKGLITYHRTDITKLSDYFIEKAKEYITSKYGEEYLSEKTKKFNPDKKTETKKNSDKNVQAAHEAIRPTDINKISPQDLSELEKKVYKMIWVRAVASLMAKEKCRRYTANILFSNTTNYNFLASYLMTIFKGFKILTNEEETEDANKVIVDLNKDDSVKYIKILSEQSFTEASKRYTEASLVKELENKGIGRPSTYASIVDTVQARKYVIKKNDSPVKKKCIIDTLSKGDISSKTIDKTFGDKKKRLFPTELGITTTNFLAKNLSTLMNYKFTAELENQLDEIANNQENWTDVVGNINDDMTSDINKIPKKVITEEEKKKKKERKEARNLGTYDNEKMEYIKTKYGPRVKWGDVWCNLADKYDDPKKVTEEIAVKAVKKQLEKNRLGKLITFPYTDGERKGNLIVSKGQYGFYGRFIPDKGKPTKEDTFNLPDDARDSEEEASELTLEELVQCMMKKRNKNKGLISFNYTDGKRKGKLIITKGQYGFYVKFIPDKGKPKKDDNFFLPKDIRDDEEMVASLTLEDLVEAVENTRKYRASK
jgi:DNA topoisomerase-1